MDLIRNFVVAVVMSVHIDAVRAEAVGFLDAHAGTDAVGTGFVGAGGDNATFGGKGADDQRFAGQGRVVVDFH